MDYINEESLARFINRVNGQSSDGSTEKHGMYLTAVMGITTLSITMTVVVLNFHYRGPSKKRAPVWLKRLILGRLGAIFCSDVVDCPPRRSTTSPPNGNSSADTPGGPTVRQPRVANHVLPRGGAKTPPPPSPTAPSSPDARSCDYHQEILGLLRSMVRREEQESQRADVVNEWRQMAVVIDRVLFWLFLVALVMCSVVFLLIVPYYRDDLTY